LAAADKSKMRIPAFLFMDFFCVPLKMAELDATRLLSIMRANYLPSHPIGDPTDKAETDNSTLLQKEQQAQRATTSARVSFFFVLKLEYRHFSLHE